jgi:hypothetical protein
LLDEFYRVAFRKKLYSSINELQVDLDLWLTEYNEHRTIRDAIASARPRCRPSIPVGGFEDARKDGAGDKSEGQPVSDSRWWRWTSQRVGPRHARAATQSLRVAAVPLRAFDPSYAPGEFDAGRLQRMVPSLTNEWSERPFVLRRLAHRPQRLRFLRVFAADA